MPKTQRKQEISDDQFKLNELETLGDVRRMVLEVAGEAPPAVVLELFDMSPSDEGTGLMDPEDAEAFKEDLQEAHKVACAIFQTDKPDAATVKEVFERWFFEA